MNIGDLVTTLSADTGGYREEMQQGVRANDVFSGSLDAIIGKLSRAQKRLSERNFSSRDHILKSARTENATEGQINAALQKLEEVEALQKQAKAEDEVAKAKLRADAATRKLLGGLQQEQATLGMNANELALYKARMDGVAEADINRARTMQRNIEVERNWSELQETLNTRTSRLQSETNRLQRSNLLLIESIRGIEDAAAGASIGGLRGMLMATTNNVNQIGALLGGMKGTAISVASVAALIGVSIIPKLYEWATSTEAITKAEEDRQKRMEKSLERTIKLMDDLRSHRDKIEDNRIQFNRRLPELDESKQIQAEINRLNDAKRKANNDRNAAFRENRQMAKADPRVVQELREFEDKKPRDWDGYWAGEISDEDFEKLVEKREKLNDKKRELLANRTKINRGEETIAQADRELKILEKQLAVVKAKEEIAANSKYNKQAADDRNEEIERANRARKGVREELRDVLGDRSALFAEEQRKQEKKDRQKKLVEEAAATGILTKRQANILENVFNKPEVFAPGGNAEAATFGSSSAYSSLARAFTQTNKDNFEKQQYEEAKKVAPLLEQLRDKPVINVYTLD